MLVRKAPCFKTDVAIILPLYYNKGVENKRKIFPVWCQVWRKSINPATHCQRVSKRGGRIRIETNNHVSYQPRLALASAKKQTVVYITDVKVYLHLVSFDYSITVIKSHFNNIQWPFNYVLFYN
jgi:hypothetical protein